MDGLELEGTSGLNLSIVTTCYYLLSVNCMAGTALGDFHITYLILAIALPIKQCFPQFLCARYLQKVLQCHLV